MVVRDAYLFLCCSSDIYGGASAKYVPPHQRVKNEEEQTQHDQVRERLRKQVKGLLNRYENYICIYVTV